MVAMETNDGLAINKLYTTCWKYRGLMNECDTDKAWI